MGWFGKRKKRTGDEICVRCGLRPAKKDMRSRPLCGECIQGENKSALDRSSQSGFVRYMRGNPLYFVGLPGSANKTPAQYFSEIGK